MRIQPHNLFVYCVCVYKSKNINMIYNKYYYISISLNTHYKEWFHLESTPL